MKKINDSSPAAFFSSVLFGALAVTALLFAMFSPSITSRLAQFITALVCGAVGIFVLRLSMEQMHVFKLVRDTRRSDIRSLSPGLVSITGIVKPVKTLRSPLTGTPCVYWRLKVSQYRRSDISGNVRFEWQTLSDNHDSTSFSLDDGTGSIMVNPSGASIRTPASNTSHEMNAGQKGPPDSQTHAIYYDGRRTTAEKASPGDIKREEFLLLPGDELYLLGTASMNEQMNRAAIERDNRNGPFIISTDGKDVTAQGEKFAMMMGFVISSVFIIVSLALWIAIIGRK